MPTWADRIAVVMEQKKLTQADLARICKVSRSAVNQWFSGKSGPKPENVFALADGTGYAARWLATGELPEKFSERTETAQMRSLWRAYCAATDDQRKVVDLTLGFPGISAQKNIGKPE